MRHRLQMQQWVPYALEDVFDFFANPNNLPPLMPAWQKARIESKELVTPPEPLAGRQIAVHAPAGAGTKMRISFRPLPLLPVRMRWDASIVEFGWDDHFCDEQPSGPFAYWRHCHHVRREARGGVDGTFVTDDVTYAFPLGMLGDVVNLLGGGLQVRSIFKYRQQQLLRLLPQQLAEKSGASAALVR
jgi:ligand-binding SRPBCC domain-containing protein